ncbi:MAG: transporter [Desulfobacterota bacterium]|nr:transporter [Thermodesulfobacteriota bacterium]
MRNVVFAILIGLYGVCCSAVAHASDDNGTVFSRFIKPMTNPVYFDDARNETYVHIFHAHQRLPNKIKTTLGRVPLDGDLRLTALRINYAINERFSLVAAKDGYINFNPDNTLEHEEGWGDIAAGVKYALLYQPEHEFILSGKVLFELSQGSRDVYQGNGHGNVAPSLTFLKGYNKIQLSGMVGGLIPFSNHDESTMVFDSWHVSYNIMNRLFPLLELNHYWVVRQAERDELVARIARFEGGDVVNLGSNRGMENRHQVSVAAGMRIRCMKNLDMGFAYEVPMTDKNASLMKDRLNFDMVIHF